MSTTKEVGMNAQMNRKIVDDALGNEAAGMSVLLNLDQKRAHRSGAGGNMIGVASPSRTNKIRVARAEGACSLAPRRQ